MNIDLTVRSRLRLLVIVVLGAFSLWTVPLFVVELFFVPQTTFGIDIDDQTLRIAVDGSLGAQAGPRDGDRLDVARMSYEDRAELFTGWSMRMNWPVGTPLTVPVINGRSEPQIFHLRAVPNHTAEPPQFRFTIWTHAMIAFLWVLIGAVVVAVRPSVMTWAFYFFCLAFHPFPKFGFYMGPPWVTALLISGFVIVYAVGLAGIVSFAARFPRGRAEGGWKYFELAALPVFLGLVLLHGYEWVPEVLGTPNVLDTGAANVFSIFLVAALVLAALVVKLIRLRGSERAAVAWVFAGYALCNAAIAIHLAHVPFVRTDWESFAVVAFDTLGTASFPFFVAYAIVWHRAFALGFVTNRVLVYGFFAAIIGLLIGVSDWLVSAELTYRNLGIGVALAIAFAAGLVMQSQYRRAIRLVDRIFLPQRYAAGVRLDRIRETLASGSGRVEGLAAEVADALGLTSVAVFGRTNDGGFVREVSCGWSDGSAWHVLPNDDLCRTLARGPGLVRLSEDDVREISLPGADARPQIAIAVRRRGRVERAILIGSHRSATTLDRDVVRGLAAVFAEPAA